jgi:hypothetical protein
MARVCEEQARNLSQLEDKRELQLQKERAAWSARASERWFPRRRAPKERILYREFHRQQAEARHEVERKGAEEMHAREGWRTRGDLTYARRASDQSKHQPRSLRIRHAIFGDIVVSESR